MLNQIICGSVDTSKTKIMCDNRYERDMQEDMKTAIDLLWKFKEGLQKLHPECEYFMQKMINNGC